MAFTDSAVTDMSFERVGNWGSVGRNKPQGTDCVPPMYQVASWRGIEFFVDTSSDEFGRRGDIYEYPLSDYIGYKDLGKRAERFKVEGYLIGSDQPEQSRRMRYAAIAPEPDILVHPMFGSLRVACISLTMTADYRRDKKRTKLAFDFCEANDSMAPYSETISLDGLFAAQNESIFAAQQGTWDPSAGDMQTLRQLNSDMKASFGNATDIPSFDAQDMLNRWGAQTYMGQWQGPTLPPAPQRIESRATLPTNIPGMSYPVTLQDAVAPIDYASATIRRIHTDALKRLRQFNSFVVQRSEQLAMPSPSAQSLIITTRLIVIRDYSIAVAQNTYTTIKEALDDLDFVMAVYDDEEAAATQRCDDVLVSTIRTARAAAASVILNRNIRLPGIGNFPTDGVWPSLLVAQKLYNDGRRYQQVENYNPHMTPFFMGGPPGQDVVAPSR